MSADNSAAPAEIREVAVVGRADAILTTNTSSLSVTAAQVRGKPEPAPCSLISAPCPQAVTVATSGTTAEGVEHRRLWCGAGVSPDEVRSRSRGQACR